MPFLFGVAGRSRLPGSALNHLLVDLGLSTAAARALVARLLAAGQLASERRGRGAEYRLAGDMRRGFNRILAGFGQSTSSWNGSFHALLYQVPEQHRPYRDRLRRAALLTGYGLLQQGVLIAPTDLSEGIADVLAESPGGARVSVVELRMTIEEARQLVFEAWDLDQLQRRYRAHIRTLHASLRSSVAREPSAETLRRFAALSIAPLVDVLRDPRLPVELLPAQWPRGELSEVISQLHQQYGPPAAEYLHRVLADLA